MTGRVTGATVGGLIAGKRVTLTRCVCSPVSGIARFESGSTVSNLLGISDEGNVELVLE